MSQTQMEKWRAEIMQDYPKLNPWMADVLMNVYQNDPAFVLEKAKDCMKADKKATKKKGVPAVKEVLLETDFRIEEPGYLDKMRADFEARYNIKMEAEEIKNVPVIEEEQDAEHYVPHDVDEPVGTEPTEGDKAEPPRV